MAVQERGWRRTWSAWMTIFFDEDEVLDYLWYEEMRKEDEGPDKPQAGCFGILILLLTPASGLGCLLYSCL